jgi:hypothetical protein
MYIGPWQEYKLSQAQARRAPAPQGQGQGLAAGGPDIREGLQQTLLQTLSPEDVAKIMAAMNPLLDRNNNANGPSIRPPSEQSALPPLPSGRRQQHQAQARGRHQRQAAERERERERAQPGATLHEQFKLPSINSPKYRTDAQSPGQGGTDTPQSVRSSKSEPLHSSRLPKRPKHNIRAFSPPVDTARTGYNSSNLVAALRLERRSRPTLNDTAKKSDFGQFWSWKGGGGGSEAGTPSISMAVEPKKPKAETVLDDKIAKVKNMHKLYTSGQIGQGALDEAAGALLSLDVASPLRASTHTYKKPQTPVIQERDVTSTDLAVVSKYFKENRSPGAVGDGYVYSQPLRALSVSPGASPPLEDNDGDGDDDEIAEADEHSNSEGRGNHEGGNSGTGRIICSPVQCTDTGGGGSFGSPDGLLHWTQLLNPDEIDAMY